MGSFGSDGHKTLNGAKSRDLPGINHIGRKISNESDSLSDIEDAEVAKYLHTEEEKRYKTIIWEKLNRKYLQEQAAKELAGDVKKPRKERNRKKDPKSKDERNPTKATQEKASNKRLSSRINYDILNQILGETEGTENTKRARIERESEDNATSNRDEEEEEEEDLEKGGEYGDEGTREYGSYSCYGNDEEWYDDDADDGLY